MVIIDKQYAEITLSMLASMGISDLKYDEALWLFNDCVVFIQQVGPHDPAFMHFVNQRDGMLKYMTALNVKEDLNRHDHLTKVKLMITGRASKEIDEVEIELPHFFNRDKRAVMADAIIVAKKTLVDLGKTKLNAGEVIEEAVLL